MLDATVATAISVNLIVLLIVSWTFSIFFLGSLRKDKARLSKMLADAIKNYQQLKLLLESQQMADAPTVKDDALAGFVEDMEKSAASLEQLQNSRGEQLRSLEKIEAAAEAMVEDEEVKALRCELSMLRAQIIHADEVMSTMKVQATAGRHRLSVLEEKLENSKDFPIRIAGLEETQGKLRDSNKQLTEKLEESRLKVKSLNFAKSENSKIKSTLDNYILKNKNSERLIVNLQDKLAEAQGMLEKTRESIESFAKPLDVNVDDANLDDLKENLSRALQEKQSIEEQYLALLTKVEEAGNVTEQLQRTQNECAMLEQSYLALMTELESRDGTGDDNSDTTNGGLIAPADKAQERTADLDLGMSEMDSFDEEGFDEESPDESNSDESGLEKESSEPGSVAGSVSNSGDINRKASGADDEKLGKA